MKTSDVARKFGGKRARGAVSQWVEKNKFRSLQRAWDRCQIPEWMGWYVDCQNGKIRREARRKISLEIARIALSMLPKKFKKRAAQVYNHTKKYKWVKSEEDDNLENISVGMSLESLEVNSSRWYHLARMVIDCRGEMFSVCSIGHAIDTISDRKICNAIRRAVPKI